MSWEDILKMGSRNTQKEKELTDYFDNLSVEELDKVINEINTFKAASWSERQKAIWLSDGLKIKGIIFYPPEEQDEPEGMSYQMPIGAYRNDETGDSFGTVFVGNDGTIESYFEIRDKAPEQDYGGVPHQAEWRSEAGY